MKRTYEMVQNKSQCEHCNGQNCEASCQNEFQSDGDCQSQAEKSDRTFITKKSKFIDYIKESFRSVRRWFVGTDRHHSDNYLSKLSPNNEMDPLFTLGISNNDNTQYPEGIKPMDYSLTIRSPSYKIRDINATDTHPFEHVISPVQLTKRNMKEVNWLSNRSASNMAINVQRRLNLYTPIDTNNMKKPFRNHCHWGANSFLLKSSNTLNPRQYNAASVPTMGREIDLGKASIDSLFENVGDPITPHMTIPYQNMNMNLNPNLNLNLNLNLNDNKTDLLKSPSTLKSAAFGGNGVHRENKFVNESAILNAFDFSSNYFNMKITALNALTSNDYHKKEKDYIIQQIKEHQEKRRQLKTQYELLSIDHLFELPQKELFPKLDQDLLRKYYECVKNNSVNGFDIKLPNDNISCKDLKTLLDLNWLNDEVINFYLDLINKRSNNNTTIYPLVHSFNTFFYEKLSRSGYNGVRRWTKKINIFEKQFILFPIHLAVHWCMCVVDNVKHTINYYDSLLSPNYDCVEKIKEYLMEEHNAKYNKPINFEGWLFDCPRNIPKQHNGSDCGVFACTFGEYIAREAAFDFNQENMPYFRQKMVYEIFQNKLLL